MQERVEWCRIMKAKYLNQRHFFRALDLVGLPPGSKIWNNILKSRSLLKEGVRWKIGNGRSIRFWEDSWIGRKSLADSHFNILREHTKDLIGTYITDYTSPSARWKILKLSFLHWANLLPKVAELQELLNSVRLSLFPKEDKIFWMKNHSGEFTVKSSYQLLLRFGGDEQC